MKRTLLGISVSVFVLASGPRVFADHITEVLDTWNANMAGNNICGLAFDQTTGNVWVYQCFAADLQRYSSDGTFLSSVPRPGDPANDVDIDIAPEALTLGGTPIPAGTLLFIDGEFGVAEIYAVDKTTGTVLASLTTGFGANLVVGGVYHSSRNTFFLVSASDTVAEVDPITGAVLSTFPTLPSYNVSFGDIEVDPGTGNLYLVSSASTSMAEFTTGGTFVQLHPQPPLVSLLSGIGLDDATDEVWVANQLGDVWRLGSPLPPCAAACAKQNVECLNPSPEYDTRTAVGRVVTPSGSSCTGWIIAAPNLILTNRHCITTNGAFDGPIGDVTTMSIEFNYECDACVGGAVKPTTTFNVTALVVDSASLDFAILQTTGNPAAGWGQLTVDSNPPVVGEGVYEHHHAEGAVKGYDNGVVTSAVAPDQCLTGTTEFGVDIIATGGASGAPMFRA